MLSFSRMFLKSPYMCYFFCRVWILLSSEIYHNMFKGRVCCRNSLFYNLLSEQIKKCVRNLRETFIEFYKKIVWKFEYLCHTVLECVSFKKIVVIMLFKFD